MDRDRYSYIYILNTHSSGVIQKIRHQLLTAESIKLKMDWYVFGDESVRQSLSDLMNLKRLNFQLLPEVSSNFGRLLRRLFKYRLVDRVVPWHLYKATVIRYAWSIDPYAPIFFWRRGRMLFTEHNTLELNELSKMNYFGKLGPLLGFLESVISPVTLSQVRGSIAVTSEIAIDLKKRCGVRSTRVIANGISTAECYQRFFSYSQKEIEFLFLSSTFEKHHGLDLLLHSLERYSGDIPIKLHIVGNLIEPLVDLRLPTNVSLKIHGHLRKESIKDLFNRVNLAFGSLALTRYGMQDACTLKSREYIAHGVPIAYAYKDPDLQPDLPFVLQMETSEESYDIQKIVDFVHSLGDQKGLSEIMYKFSQDKLDWKVKLEQLIEYLRSETISEQL